MKMNIKRWIYLLIVVVIIAVVVSFLLRTFVHQRQEVMLCQDFLDKHVDIFAYLAPIKSISYNQDSSAKVSFYGDRIEGVYGFTIKGESSDTDIRIFWSNSPKGDAFKVIRIEQLDHGNTPDIIWENTQ